MFLTVLKLRQVLSNFLKKATQMHALFLFSEIPVAPKNMIVGVNVLINITFNHQF